MKIVDQDSTKTLTLCKEPAICQLSAPKKCRERTRMETVVKDICWFDKNIYICIIHTYIYIFITPFMETSHVSKGNAQPHKVLLFDAAISYLSLILVCLQEFPVDLNVYLSMPWKDLPSSKKNVLSENDYDNLKYKYIQWYTLYT